MHQISMYVTIQNICHVLSLMWSRSLFYTTKISIKFIKFIWENKKDEIVPSNIYIFHQSLSLKLFYTKFYDINIQFEEIEIIKYY